MPKHTPVQVNTKEELVEKFSASLKHVAEDFYAGLKHGIMMTLASNAGLTYLESLDRAQNMETTRSEMRPTPTITPVPTQDIKKPNAPSQAKGYKPRFTPCPKCNKVHGGICMAGTDICFVCNKSGHIAKKCPNKPPGTWARPMQAVQSPQPQAKQAQFQVNTVPTLPPQQQNFRKKRKWEGDQTPHEHKKQQTARNHPQVGGKQAAPKQKGKFQSKAPPCAKCSKNHFGKCRVGTDKCYSCGRDGHFARDCPKRNAGAGARQNLQGQRPQLRAIQAEPNEDQTPPQQQQHRRQRLPTQARAYALRPRQPKAGKETQGQDNLAGMGTLLNIPIAILFDTGALHSFISMSCVDTLGLPTKGIEHKMSVSSSVGGLIDVTHTCSNVEFMMGNLKLVAHDLHVMSMRNVDIILGMDWLAENYATILCKERKRSPCKPQENNQPLCMGFL